MSKQVTLLEKTIAFQEKSHLKSVKHLQKKIKQLNRQAALKADQTSVLEVQLSDMQAAVAEKSHIYDTAADDPSMKTEERYQEIVLRRNLKDLAQAQAEELALLRAEVNRLRMKNFPSLNQLKHH